MDFCSSCGGQNWHKNPRAGGTGEGSIWRKTIYLPTLPVRPAFCRAAKTSCSLKSPLTVNDLTPLAAVLPVTPATEPSAVFTDFTHLPQHRCTPSTCNDLSF